ncbi:MAG: esterase-like activity of phytase family protein, partial [Erythrobacter sp.]|nr:esterase-like activity of phytase family protein [Erythrobacter sp.]
ILLAGLLALALAPGTFVRSEILPPDFHSPVAIAALDFEPATSGPLVLDGAWKLTSANDHFGGYSALIAWKKDEFLAANDAGRLMHLPRPDRTSAAPRLDKFLNFERADKSHVDVESLTFDPKSGEVWAGLEWAQQIIRFSPRLQMRAQVRPDEMKGWGGNSGPESLVRLKDGRFVVIEEQASGKGLHEALVFPHDPTTGVEPVRFTFQARPGYRPADATLLPNGKMAVLLRGFRLALPPRFPALLVIADPEAIREGKVLDSRFLARIDRPFPSDNYEGLAVTAERDGIWNLWLISDDNFASYQNTLLIKLRWDVGGGRKSAQARQKARR